MKQPFKIVILVLSLGISLPSSNFGFSAGKEGAFSIPIKWERSINEYLSFKHVYYIYHTSHPHFQNLYTSNEAQSSSKYNSHITGVVQTSILQYQKNNLNLVIGKDYIDNNNDLFFSNNSFPLNHFMFSFSKKRIDYNYYVIRLNDDTDPINSVKITRYLYYRDLFIKFNNRLSMNLSESMLVTGYNRNIDWYYLTPGSMFGIESQHHEYDIQEDNPNAFLGFGFNYKINKNYTLKSRFIIDDFQKDAAGKKEHEDVFGFLLGLIYNKNQVFFSIEYQYASPWLYTNMNSSAYYENYSYPIGLRYPNSHMLKIHIECNLDNAIITSSVLFGEKGEQNIETEWDSANNNIDNFNFMHTINPEVYFRYDFLSKNKFIPDVLLFHNWRESNKTDLILEWSFLFGNKGKI